MEHPKHFRVIIELNGTVIAQTGPLTEARANKEKKTLLERNAKTPFYVVRLVPADAPPPLTPQQKAFRELAEDILGDE